MSSFGILELAFGAIAMVGYAVGAAVVGTFKALVFAGKVVAKVINKRQEKIRGLSDEVQKLYSQVAASLNESSERLINDANEFERDLQSQSKQFLDKYNEADAEVKANIEKTAEDAFRNVVHKLDDSIAAIDTRMNDISKSANSLYIDYNRKIGNAMAEINNLKIAESERLERATEVANQQLNDAKLLLENFKSDKNLLKYAENGAITDVWETTLKKAENYIISKNYEYMQSAIISSDSVIKEILIETVKCQKEMEQNALRTGQFHSNLQTTRRFLTDSRRYTFTRGKARNVVDLTNFVGDDFASMYDEIDNEMKKIDNNELISEEDVNYAEALISKAVLTVQKGIALAETYEARLKIEALLKKELPANGLEYIGSTSDFSQEGAVRKLKFRSNSDNRDIIIDLYANKCGELKYSPQFNVKVFHMAKNATDTNAILNTKYQGFIRDALDKAGFSNTGFKCAGNIETNTTPRPVDSNEAMNWNNVVTSCENYARNMVNRNNEIHNEQMKRS